MFYPGTDYGYVAVSLDSGGYWRIFSNDINFAVGNLDYVGRDLNITIE
jgi:hypothetical protein